MLLACDGDHRERGEDDKHNRPGAVTFDTG